MKRDEFESGLPRALAELADEERTIGAPPRVGRALQAAFEERQRAAPVVPFPSRGVPARALAAAAALLVAVSAWAVAHWRAKPPQAMTNPMEIARATVAPPAIRPTSETPKVLAPVRHRARPRVRTEAPEATTLSLGLLPGDGAADFEQIVRLRIPRATLRLWGLAIRDEDPGELVQAEVTFGENGVARSIRLLN